MVITKLYGGLGNQMFQYAAGLAVSRKLGSNLYLDLSWFDEVKSSREVTQRVYELDGFGIKPRGMTLVDKISLRRNPSVVFLEQNLGYQPAFKELSGNVMLDGYWQSHRYFEDYRQDVLEAFKFPAEISPANSDLQKKIFKTQSISLHVRRGDYTTKVGRNYHGLLPRSYYEQALTRLKKPAKKPSLFIFSDDIKWCKQNIKFDFPSTYIDSNGPNSGVEDMRLMSSCKHNIIANSSFSWWAAWLNQNPKKTIYAPKVWFKDADAHLNDRLPEEWVVL